MNGDRKIRVSALVVPIVLVVVVIGLVLFLVLRPAPQEAVIEKPGITILLPDDELSAVVWHDGFVWCGGREGVYRIEPDTLAVEAVEAPDHIPRFQYVRGLLSYHEALWIAYDGGVARLDGTGWRAAYEGFPDVRMTSLCAAPDGLGVWAGSYDGMVLLDNDMRLQRVMLEQDGLISSMVNVISADSRGNMWFGSYLERPGTGGVSVLYPDGHIQQITDEQGLPHHDITSFLLLENGDMLVGCGMLNRGGAARLAPAGNGEYEVVQTWAVEDGLAGEKVRFLYGYGEQIWFCSETNGIAVWEAGTFISIWTKDDSAGSNRCLVPIGCALDMAFRQNIARLLPAFGTNESIGPALGYKIFPAAGFVVESLDELDQTEPLFLRHDPFPHFSVSCLYSTTLGVQ